jgi:hypothetical protein
MKLKPGQIIEDEAGARGIIFRLRRIAQVGEMIDYYLFYSPKLPGDRGKIYSETDIMVERFYKVIL